MKDRFAAIFKQKTRDEWAEVFEGTDGCGAPVLSPWEAHEHPTTRLAARSSRSTGSIQPGPAPRFGRTPAAVSRPPSSTGCRHRRGTFGLGSRRRSHRGPARARGDRLSRGVELRTARRRRTRRTGTRVRAGVPRSRRGERGPAHGLGPAAVGRRRVRAIPATDRARPITGVSSPARSRRDASSEW